MITIGDLKKAIQQDQILIRIGLGTPRRLLSINSEGFCIHRDTNKAIGLPLGIDGSVKCKFR